MQLIPCFWKRKGPSPWMLQGDRLNVKWRKSATAVEMAACSGGLRPARRAIYSRWRHDKMAVIDHTPYTIQLSQQHDSQSFTQPDIRRLMQLLNYAVTAVQSITCLKLRVEAGCREIERHSGLAINVLVEDLTQLAEFALDQGVRLFIS